MANLTTCPKCGKCYEEKSEEEANSPNRCCAQCALDENSLKLEANDYFRLYFEQESVKEIMKPMGSGSREIILFFVRTAMIFALRQHRDLKLKKLKDQCQEYLDFIFSEDYHEDGMGDREHYIFEHAMELFHGEEIWNKINERI